MPLLRLHVQPEAQHEQTRPAAAHAAHSQGGLPGVPGGLQDHTVQADAHQGEARDGAVHEGH